MICSALSGPSRSTRFGKPDSSQPWSRNVGSHPPKFGSPVETRSIYRSVIASVATFGLLLALPLGGVQASAAASPSSPSQSAYLIRPGHPLGVVPRVSRAGATTRSLAPGVNPHCTSCAPPLQYHSPAPVMGGISHPSGPVGAVTITPYYWDPSPTTSRRQRLAGWAWAHASTRRHGGRRWPATGASPRSRISVLHGTSST